MMDRRRFLLTSLAGVIGAPVAAEAQRHSKSIGSDFSVKLLLQI